MSESNSNSQDFHFIRMIFVFLLRIPAFRVADELLCIYFPSLCASCTFLVNVLIVWRKFFLQSKWKKKLNILVLDGTDFYRYDAKKASQRANLVVNFLLFRTNCWAACLDFSYELDKPTKHMYFCPYLRPQKRSK